MAWLLCGITDEAHADEPRRASEPILLQEAAEIMSVADALDEADPFDVQLQVGLQQSWKSSEITRETHECQSS